MLQCQQSGQSSDKSSCKSFDGKSSRRHRTQGIATAAVWGAVALAAFAPLTTPATADFNDKNPIGYSVDGGTATGYFKVVTEALNGIVREAYPGSDATYKPGSPAGGMVNIASGKSDFIFNGAAPEVAFALEGKAPFKESLAGKFSVIMRLHQGLIVNNLMLKDWADKNGIRSFGDIVAKKPAMRLGVNTQANLQSTVSMYIALFEAYGVPEAELLKNNVQLFRGNTAEGLTQLRDGKIDVLINGAFLPTAEIADIARGRPLLWVEADKDRIQAAADRWRNGVARVPAGVYPFVERDTWTTSQWNTALAGNHVSEETVYKFLTALVDNAERVRKVHPSLAEFSLETIVQNPTNVPLHPGAARFFREKGVLK